MRKLIILLLSFFLINCKLPKYGQGEKKTDTTIAGIEKGIEKKELAADTAKPIASKDSSNNEKDTASVRSEKGEIYVVYKKEEELTIVKDWLPLIISFLGWAAAIVSLWYIHKDFLRGQRHKNLEFLSEVDKMLVNDPKLWAIYDRRRIGYLSTATVNADGNIEITGQEKIIINGEIEILAKTNLSLLIDGPVTIIKNGVSPLQSNLTQPVLLNSGDKINAKASSNTNIIVEGTAIIEKAIGSMVIPQEKTNKELNGKLEAFCYYKINNFESVFLESSKKGKVYETWRYYMVHTIMRSGIFEKTVGEAIKGKLYEPVYTDLLIDFIAKAKLLKPHYIKWKEGKLNDKNYEEKIKEIVSPSKEKA